MAKVLKAIALALILAILLAIIGAIVAGEGQENALFAIFFLVGLIGFSVLFLKVQRVGFWFCLSYAIEWALLPMAAAINVAQPQTSDQSGCAVLVGAIVATIFLAITIPIGAIGFVLFLLLALLVFRKKKPHTAKPTTKEPSQP
jgi:hypothetical protein